jgi:hypothetical protein
VRRQKGNRVVVATDHVVRPAGDLVAGGRSAAHAVALGERSLAMDGVLAPDLVPLDVIGEHVGFPDITAVEFGTWNQGGIGVVVHRTPPGGT